MDATIRPARAEDAATVAAVHNRSRAQAFRGHIADEVLDNYAPLERKWAEYFDAPDGRVYLAEVDGEAVGMAYGVPGGHPGERTELCNLYLLEHAAGNGISGKLLAAVVHPGEPAFLWVAEFNERAQAFYAKQGFTFDREETHHAGDGVTLRRMVRG